MTRSKILRVRLSEQEWKTLEEYAQAKEYTRSEVIRDYIKTLSKIHPIGKTEGLLLEER